LKKKGKKRSMTGPGRIQTQKKKKNFCAFVFRRGGEKGKTSDLRMSREESKKGKKKKGKHPPPSVGKRKRKNRQPF